MRVDKNNTIISCEDKIADAIQVRISSKRNETLEPYKLCRQSKFDRFLILQFGYLVRNIFHFLLYIKVDTICFELWKQLESLTCVFLRFHFGFAIWNFQFNNLNLKFLKAKVIDFLKDSSTLHLKKKLNIFTKQIILANTLFTITSWPQIHFWQKLDPIN